MPRKAFNFYRSYFDVMEELPEKDQLSFIKAVLRKQFIGEEPNLKGMAKFAYISQKHSIDLQVKGYEDKTGETLSSIIIEGSVPPSTPPLAPPPIQGKGEGKEKVELTITETFLKWFNNQKKIHTKKAGKFKVLSSPDLTNLKTLKKSYDSNDFKNAISMLFKSDWAKRTGNETPSHFLRVDNFNRYLNQSTQEPDSSEKRDINDF